LVICCKICEDELDSEEEDEGICEICQDSRQIDEEEAYGS
jgi:hypothetical protein